MKLFTRTAVATRKNSHRIRIADGFANVPVINQFGERFHFHRDLVGKNQPMIMNMMYTTCRGTCPGTSQCLEILRHRLVPYFGTAFQMISITLEPQVDTKVRLCQYARSYGADKPQSKLAPWHFLTCQPDDLTQLRKSLGFYDLNPLIENDITRHASLLYFGNPQTDRWAVLPAEMRMGVLIESIRRVAGVNNQQRYGIE